MPSRSPSQGPARGRSRTRSHTPSHSQSPRRSITPRSQSRSLSARRSVTPRGARGRSRSYSRSRSADAAPRAPAVKSAKIVVEKLTKNVTENHLREIFGAYGPVQDVDLPMNRQCEDALLNEHAGTILTIGSQHKSRHSIHHLYRYRRRRSCHRTHARRSTGWRGHQRLHRPPASQILPLSTSISSSSSTSRPSRPKRTSRWLPRTTAS